MPLRLCRVQTSRRCGTQARGEGCLGGGPAVGFGLALALLWPAAGLLLCYMEPGYTLDAPGRWEVHKDQAPPSHHPWPSGSHLANVVTVSPANCLWHLGDISLQFSSQFFFIILLNPPSWRCVALIPQVECPSGQVLTLFPRYLLG